jgi:hypothetical protein
MVPVVPLDMHRFKQAVVFPYLRALGLELVALSP